MADFKIISDSTSDLPLDLVTELEVHIIPMIYTIDGQDFTNSSADTDKTSHEFYEKLRGGKMPTTSQINMETYKQAFTPYLKQGLDILYICFSSGLSSSYNSALIAVSDLKEDFPDSKIVVVDSLSASLGEGLLVYHTAMQKKSGKNLEETVAWLEENKLHIAHWFTVEDLNHLKRGGRLSSAAALVGTMLNIKPVLQVDDEGHLIPVEKIRGRRKSLDALVDHMAKTAIDPAEQIVFISHGDSPDDAQYIQKRVEEKFGVKRFVINNIGPVIGTHSGPGTIALFYFCKSRR